MLARLRLASEYAPTLERAITRLVNGQHDRALLEHTDLARQDIDTIRDRLPAIWRAIEDLLGESAIENGILRRCLRYIGHPNDTGCTPWRGATSGRHGASDPGTPVISVDGKTQSARRLLWNDRYPAGQPEHVGEGSRARLRNVGCSLGRGCMTLSHWYKPDSSGAGGHDALAAPAAGESPEDTLRRIWAKTEPKGLCIRWLGAMAGNTPVISYRGKTTVARRLLWDISYPERPLGPTERLHNEGCALGAECMTINHWRVTSGPVDLDRAVTNLLNMPAPQQRGRPCQSGLHWIRDDADHCAPCARAARGRNAARQRLAFEVGRSLRQQLRHGASQAPASEQRIATEAIADTERAAERRARR